MEELSLHILDIVENSIRAGASKIEIKIGEDEKRDLLSIMIKDNGQGMDEETLQRACDPFFTTKKNRRFGLGLPLLREAAKAANGNLTIKSKKGKGTTIEANFQYSHIDRQPLGNIGQTLLTLIIGNPEIDFLFVRKKNGHNYRLDTKKIKVKLKNKPLNSLEGIKMLRDSLKEIPKIF